LFFFKCPFVSWFKIQYDASIAFHLGFGMAMHYPSKFEKICYGAQCIFIRGIVGVLCSIEHEQYPSNSIDPWCLIIEYLNDSIGFLGGFDRATQYPSMCQKICYGAQRIFGIPR
jgi:hypothetical protein